ncbi:hypothetical protein [Kitasatospora sp. NPDC093102]|uniref:hypothetical protein n=1 Tax=Kitasatospora sp. NPDC093102 TaxID=3155069 RepID=UPI00341E4E99
MYIDREQLAEVVSFVTARTLEDAPDAGNDALTNAVLVASNAVEVTSPASVLTATKSTCSSPSVIRGSCGRRENFSTTATHSSPWPYAANCEAATGSILATRAGRGPHRWTLAGQQDGPLPGIGLPVTSRSACRPGARRLLAHLLRGDHGAARLARRTPPRCTEPSVQNRAPLAEYEELANRVVTGIIWLLAVSTVVE